MWNMQKSWNVYILFGQTGSSISDLRACLSSCGTKEYIPSGLLSAVVVSWCAGAYHLSTALQGFSRSSRMSLDTLWAFQSHTFFSGDRFLITLFACTAMLLCMKQWMNTVRNQNTKLNVTDNLLNHMPIHNGGTWHEMPLWLQSGRSECNEANKLILGNNIIRRS